MQVFARVVLVRRMVVLSLTAGGEACDAQRTVHKLREGVAFERRHLAQRLLELAAIERGALAPLGLVEQHAGLPRGKLLVNQLRDGSNEDKK